MATLKSPKIKTQNNLDRYNWHDRDIGTVKKSSGVVVASGSTAAREADRVDPWSQVNPDVAVMVEDRTSIPSFLFWEDRLDFLTNIFNIQVFYDESFYEAFLPLEEEFEIIVQQALPETFNG